MLPITLAGILHIERNTSITLCCDHGHASISEGISSSQYVNTVQSMCFAFILIHIYTHTYIYIYMYMRDIKLVRSCWP